jgi:hypothetical protein
MFDAFRADQRVGDLAHVSRPAAHHDDLQTVIVVQVDVQRGENRMVKIVLDGSEFFIEQPDVVVVDQRDGAHHRGIRGGPGLLHQFVTDDVAESLAAVVVAAPRNQLVESGQQLGVDSHADAAERAHGYIVSFRAALGLKLVADGSGPRSIDKGSPRRKENAEESRSAPLCPFRRWFPTTSRHRAEASIINYRLRAASVPAPPR